MSALVGGSELHRTDVFSSNGNVNLKQMIETATDCTLLVPDWALNMEICDICRANVTK